MGLPQVNKDSADYGKPFSFLKGCGCATGFTTKWKLRSLRSQIAQLDHAFDNIKGKKERKTYLKSKGLRAEMKSVM